MEQNLKNHSRYIPLYHIISPLLLLAITIGAIRNLFQSLDDDHRLYNAALIVAITVLLWIIWWYTRAFPIRAQDRVIMLEERLRHQQLTGRALNPDLRPAQIIALRFASDAEFSALAEKAAAENLSSRQIKESIKSWRADNFRV
jgi:hypothetical protein